MAKYVKTWDIDRKGWTFTLEGKNGSQTHSAVFFGRSKTHAGLRFTMYNMRNRAGYRDYSYDTGLKVRECIKLPICGIDPYDFDNVKIEVEVDGKVYSRTERIMKAKCETRDRLNELRKKYGR